jgi:penicillin-binding protein 1A
LNKGIKNAPKGINQGALVTVDVKSGGVLALVGGVGPFLKHQWNRAVSPHTAGSSFKPFVYLAAFEKGSLKPSDEVDDSPVVIPQKDGEPYEPKNFDDEFKGYMPVTQSLAMSRNTCAIRIAQLAGIPNVISVARRSGISSRLDPYISLALGSAAVSPLEMSGAYACFVRNGAYVKPNLFRRIEDSNGRLVKEFRTRTEKRLKPEAVAQLHQCLQTVVENGTGIKARIPGVPVIGKTGTTDGATDVWFVGATPTEATAVWGGTDKPYHKKNNYITGGNLMTVIWREHTASYVSARKQKFKPAKKITPVPTSANSKEKAKAV